MDPIQIKPEEAREGLLVLPYSSERIATIKAVIGRRRHQGRKY